MANRFSIQRMLIDSDAIQVESNLFVVKVARFAVRSMRNLPSGSRGGRDRIRGFTSVNVKVMDSSMWPLHG